MKTNNGIQLLIVILLFTTLPVWGGGENAKENEKPNFWERLVIRHNLDTTNNVAQPAFLQITIPDEGEKTIGVGIGLMFKVVDTDLIDWGLFAEYKRDTQTDKEQNVIKTGMAMEWQWYKVEEGESSHSPILIPKLNYKNDEIENTKSIQASIAYTHMFTGSDFPLPNTTWNPLKFFQLIYSPYLGMEYENVINAGDDGRKGDVLRGYFQIEVVLYPMGEELDQTLEFALGYTYKKDLVNSILDENRSYELLKAGISYYFLKEDSRSFGIGITYVNGEDPYVGLEKQKYIKVGLTFKVN